MRRFDRHAMATAMALLLAVSPALAQERTLRLGHLAAEDNVWHLA
jgi:TRAP-type C4-dicarboxylate transport system substrate-binding protein